MLCHEGEQPIAQFGGLRTLFNHYVIPHQPAALSPGPEVRPSDHAQWSDSDICGRISG
jgi:hypothetical protein